MAISNYITAPIRFISRFLSVTFKQTTASYCALQTADSPTVLVGHDGALCSIIRIDGVINLIGKEEFEHIQAGLSQTLQSSMSQAGHVLQVFFHYDPDAAALDVEQALASSRDTASRLSLDLQDLFQEREGFLSQFCGQEVVYFVLWTQPDLLTNEQRKVHNKQKAKEAAHSPVFLHTQNLTAAISDLRESHDAFVNSLVIDLKHLGVESTLLSSHEAVRAMRYCCDPDFTDAKWSPSLPGDQLTPKACRMAKGDISDITWPSLAAQIMPRDAENLDLKTARIGDRIYSTVFIDLFPKEVQTFVQLFSRTLQANIPWRISFLVEADGLGYAGVRSALASILTVTSKQNRLISDGLNLLSYINLNTDDAVVRLRVAAATWADAGELSVLRSRASMLARAIQSWGSCTVSEVSGDAFEGVVSSMVGVSNQSIANASIAPLSHVLHMLPLFRPCSIWSDGAILFRSPDGKLWPYHPGSSLQTTWIDLFYARPGSGKSVLSNAMNLAVCLSAGIQRLPRISVIDIGPSSSGLITLLKDALPASEKHKVAYHRLKMHVDYAINPFDTQLGCRYPMPQERAFLVNFLTLLATPVGEETAYDGVSDMVGLVVDELYKAFSDSGNPNVYTAGIEDDLDVILKEMGFLQDEVTTWWEVTDALFLSGFVHEAMLAQRHAMPVLSDVASICRLPAIVDLYGQVKAPTGEALIEAFARMLSSAVREYPIIAQITQFDLGDARVVSLDLDEVAKSGGERADRQTAVMYMLARYVLARHFYLTEDSLMDMPASYLDYHKKRIAEIREDPKRIVFDEFHRTAHSSAVRNQVIQDMREGRKWKVQIALLSQSLEDFDSVMVEFATSVFIMESGPEQSVAHTAKVFGLNETAKKALKTRVHGPQASGATFLAQFSTKKGENTQLLTATLGPIELWSLNTTADDVQLRQRLTQRLGSRNAIAYLAKRFPTGSAVKLIESRLAEYQSSHGDFIDDVAEQGVMDALADELITAYYRQQAD